MTKLAHVQSFRAYQTQGQTVVILAIFSLIGWLEAIMRFEDARAKVKLVPEFQNKKMHVDGLQEIQAVNGFRVHLERDASLNDKTQILNFKHRDLAPKPQGTVK